MNWKPCPHVYRTSLAHAGRQFIVGLLAALVSLLVAGCQQPPPTPPLPPTTQTPSATPPAAGPGAGKIKYVIVVYLENWSFDGLYGGFPGANGIAGAGEAAKQVDKLGKPLAALPPVLISASPLPVRDARFPRELPVAPYDLAEYVPPDGRTGDMIHRFYQEQYQIDGGKMDKFVAWSDNGGLVMSRYNATNYPEGTLAQEYTLADNFFHAAFGGSMLNHFWLICACTPVWPDAPPDMVAALDASGVMVKDGNVAPAGYVINNTPSFSRPYPASSADPSRRMPLQTLPTIGERLSEKGISWAWFSGSWTDALAGNAVPLVPFNYFANYAEGTGAERASQRHHGI